MPTARPHFVWFDLLTPDVASATTFYTHALGWRAKSSDLGGGASYAMLGTEHRPHVGLLPLHDDDAAPHWMGQLVVDDLDALCRRLQFLQGSILLEAHPTPEVGQVAVVADPGDAVFSPLQPDQPVPPLEPVPGGLDGAILLTDRPDLAAKTYRSLLDWSERALHPSPDGAVRVLGSRTHTPAWVIEVGDDNSPQWVPRLTVDDAVTTFDRMVQLGADPCTGPRTIEGLGTVAIVLDPWGVPIGLHSS